MFLVVNGGRVIGVADPLPMYLVVGFVLTALLAGHTYARYMRPLLRSHVRTHVIPLDTGRAYSLQRRAGKSAVSREQATMFFLSVVQPAVVQHRVVERYTPSQRTMKREVLIEGRLPSRALPSAGWPVDQQVLAPIAVPLKGLLYDNFWIDNGHGDPVSTLSYSESLELVACVVRTMLAAAYASTDGTLPQRVERAEHLALIDIMYRGRSVETPGVDALVELMEVDADTFEPPKHEMWLRSAILLVQKLAARYVVVARADCNKDGRFVVRYEQTIIPPLMVAESKGPISWAKGRLRILLGARPVNLRVSLHPASTCQSYHLYVHSEESLYLSAQEAPELREYFESRKAANPIPPYYRFRSRRGQSYAHFYSRYFPEPGEEKHAPWVHFKFYEKPPGSTFRAAVASVACFLLVWLIGYVSINAADPKTDAPAFLLIVPALTAALLGFESSGRRLLEGTLAARVSLIITGIVSLLASGLYLVTWAKIDMFPAVDFGDHREWNILWLDRTTWSVLALVALLNALYISYTYIVRAWEFTHMARPTDGESAD